VGSEGGGHPPVPATRSSTTKTLIQPPATSIVSMAVITHVHSCVYTYGVTSWQKPRGVPQGSVLFPFSFSPSSPSLISLYFSLTRCPRTNRWSKVMSPAHQRCRPAWRQTIPPGAPLTKQQRPYDAGSTRAISLNVTQHWLRARPTFDSQRPDDAVLCPMVTKCLFWSNTDWDTKSVCIVRCKKYKPSTMWFWIAARALLCSC